MLPPMTTHRNVNPRLTLDSLLSPLRSLRACGAGSDPADRVSRYAETARFDRIASLIDAWAEIQTERLVREILSRPTPWQSLRLAGVFHG